MRRIRFNLRTALLLMVCVGVALGFVASMVRRTRLQQIAVAELGQLGYVAIYDVELGQGLGMAPFGIARDLLGRDAIDSVVEVRLAITPSLLGDNTLREARPSLEKLPHLQTLDLSYSTISDAGLEALAGLSRLRSVKLVNCKYVALNDGAWLTQTPNLLSLDLRQTEVGDGAIPRLAQLEKLVYLEVGKTPLTDDGVTQLRGLLNDRCIVRDR